MQNSTLICQCCNLPSEKSFDDNGSKLYWLSFVDENKIPGTAFIGASIVAADTSENAPIVAYKKGCNPGGQIAIMEITEHQDKINPDYFHRLLTKEETENELFLKTNLN